MSNEVVLPSGADVEAVGVVPLGCDRTNRPLKVGQKVWIARIGELRMDAGEVTEVGDAISSYKTAAGITCQAENSRIEILEDLPAPE